MTTPQLDLFTHETPPQRPLNAKEFADEIQAFADFGKETQILDFPDPAISIPVYVNEFWTSKQRAGPLAPRGLLSRLFQAAIAEVFPLAA